MFLFVPPIIQSSIKYSSSKKVINNWPTLVHLFRISFLVKIWDLEFASVLSCMRGCVFYLATQEDLIFRFYLWIVRSLHTHLSLTPDLRALKALFSGLQLCCKALGLSQLSLVPTPSTKTPPVLVRNKAHSSQTGNPQFSADSEQTAVS